MFLGRIDPARSFFKYGFDFLTFCSFAITFRTWANPGVFPIMVLFSAGLMTVRFGITWKNWKQASNVDELGNALKALLYLLVTLSLFMIVAVVFVLSAWVFKAKPEAMKPVIDWGVSGLLFIGVLATFGAVVATEGLTWSRPQRWFGYPRTQTMAGAERVADSDNANRRGNGGN